jgi:hypothetical protein
MIRRLRARNKETFRDDVILAVRISFSCLGHHVLRDIHAAGVVSNHTDSSAVALQPIEHPALKLNSTNGK